MRITGKIISENSSAKNAASSLSPDSLGFMSVSSDGNYVVAEFEGDSLRSIIATVDDYLMNLAVLEKIF